MAQSLIKETGPLLTSSANISGFKGSITADGIALDFPSIKIFPIIALIGLICLFSAKNIQRN